jgi:hypothetical protein
MYQKSLRIRNAVGGYICSDKPYSEKLFVNLDDLISYIRKFFTESNQVPKRYYGTKKEE